MTKPAGRLSASRQWPRARGMASPTLSQRLENYAAQAVLRTMKLLPYRQRIVAMGWLVSRVVAPLAGWRKRVRDNLALVRPDLDPAEVARQGYEALKNGVTSLIGGDADTQAAGRALRAMTDEDKARRQAAMSRPA